MKTLSLAAALLLAAAVSSRAAAKDAEKVDFAKDVKPILQASCAKCHGLDPEKPNKRPAAKLRLDDKEGAMKGGKDGKVIVPGDAKNSLLYKVLLGSVPSPDPDSDRDIDPMPLAPKGKEFKPLAPEQIETLKKWIDQGAVWPDEAAK